VQRFYKFIVVLFLLTVNWLATVAQKAPAASTNSTTTIKGKKFSPSPLSPSQLQYAHPYTSSLALPAVWKYQNLPADYYLKMLGIVCKAEYAVEKKLNLPLALRIRAGSLDYVNKMEGKR